MKETEFQAQIESDFDEKQMDMLHEEFQLKHNEFMGDVAGQPDIPELTYTEHQAAQHKFIMAEDKDITEYIDKDGKWINAKTGEPKPEPNSPYQGDPFAENKEMYVKPSQSTEDGYEYIVQPQHYQYFDLEVIDAIERILTHDEFRGFLMGTSMRYRFRLGSKPGEPLERDLKKAERYEQYWRSYVKRNTP